MVLRGERFGWYPYGHEPWHWEYNPLGFRERFRSALEPPAATSSTPDAGPVLARAPLGETAEPAHAPSVDAASVLRLQRHAGNRATRRVLARASTWLDKHVTAIR